MRRKLSKQDKLYRKKLRDNKNLAEKALKNSFKTKPPKGLVFLNKVPAGKLVRLSPDPSNTPVVNVFVPGLYFIC